MTTTPPSTSPDDAAQTGDDGASTETTSKVVDRAVKRGGLLGIGAGIVVTLFSWGMLPGLDRLATWAAGVGGFLTGFTIPLAVLALLLPFLEDEWAVRWLQEATRWKRVAGAVGSGVQETALARPRVAAAAAGYIFVVQLAPVITEYLQDESLDVASVPWSPAAGFATCLIGLFVLHLKGRKHSG